MLISEYNMRGAASTLQDVDGENLEVYSVDFVDDESVVIHAVKDDGEAVAISTTVAPVVRQIKKSWDRMGYPLRVRFSWHKARWYIDYLQ